MKLYCIRHGEDVPGFRGGWATTPLTDNGKNQIKEASKHLLDKSIDLIITSDLIRAKESADILKDILKIDLIVDPNFREYNNGIIAGLPNDYADEKYPQYIFANIKMDDRFPEGETPREYFNRIKDALNLLINNYKDKNILLVTHGGVIDVIYHIYNKIPYSNSSKYKRHVENAEILEFDF